jgi:hypothetical protein
MWKCQFSGWVMAKDLLVSLFLICVYLRLNFCAYPCLPVGKCGKLFIFYLLAYPYVVQTAAKDNR